MVDLYTGSVPNPTQTQPAFDTNTQAILDYIATFAPQLNAWVGAYVQDTTSNSSTSNSVGTGSKTFTVESGKGYKVNMPVRASATTGNYMDGVVTAYSGTSLTVNFTAATGSGTFTSWQIFLTIPGSNVTLGSNTFTGDQFVPDESYDATAWNGDLSVPTKNAIRDKFESLPVTTTSTSDPTGAANNNNPISSNWAKLGFSISLGSSGYIFMPTWLGGWGLQWGTYTIGGAGSIPVTFPVPFNTACYLVCPFINYTGSGTPGFSSVASGTYTTNGFNLGATNALGGSYFAIGK